MKKTNSSYQQDLRRFASHVADFIRYWGFRRIHGQIWTLLFLSKEPLSGKDLVRQLRVSKALVSPALKELEKYKLIYQVKCSDSRQKNYVADEDVIRVIIQVLKTREKNLLEKAATSFATLKNKQPAELNSARMESLGSLISTAQGLLESLLVLQNLKQLSSLKVDSSDL